MGSKNRCHRCSSVKLQRLAHFREIIWRPASHKASTCTFKISGGTPENILARHVREIIWRPSSLRNYVSPTETVQLQVQLYTKERVVLADHNPISCFCTIPRLDTESGRSVSMCWRSTTSTHSSSSPIVASARGRRERTHCAGAKPPCLLISSAAFEHSHRIISTVSFPAACVSLITFVTTCFEHASSSFDPSGLFL